MRRRPAALLATLGLVASLALGACGPSGDKDQAPTATSTTLDREGGSGKDAGNSGAGNVGGQDDGPEPGANNFGG